MRLRTFGEVSTQIRGELDIQGEDIIPATEMIGYANSAIGAAEAIIHNLYEGYFRKSDRPTVTLGVQEVALPTDCYAFKIVKVYWNDGSRKYEVERLKLLDIMNVNDNDAYGYDIESATSGAGASMILYPTPRETSTYMRRWYIRTANRVVDDTSVIDIPQFSDYVEMHMRVNCAIKAGHPLFTFWSTERDTLEQRMRDTLKAMVLDGANNIEADPSFYEDFGGG